MPDRLLTRSKESLLQLEMSEVTEGSVMDVSAQMEVETTGQPLMTSTPHKKRKKKRKKKVPNAENHMCRKRTWSAKGSKTPQIG